MPSQSRCCPTQYPLSRFLAFFYVVCFIVGRHAAIDRRPLVLWLGSAILSAAAVDVLRNGQLVLEVGFGKVLQGSWKVL